MKLSGFPQLVLMTKKTDLQTWLSQAVNSLVNSDTPYLEAQVIAAFSLDKTREWVIGHPEFDLPQESIDTLNHSLNRLVKGEPLPYITGKQAFYGLDFVVTPAVLIPRPETELLVEEALQWLETRPSRRKVVDVCTGSGIIAVSLADTIPALHITAVDISEGALEVARQNSLLHQVNDRITFINDDLLTGIEGKFDLIVSNPPYIPTVKLADLSVSKFEPVLALDGGVDGLQVIYRLLQQSCDHLLPGGALFFEIESTLSEPTLQLAEQYFPGAEIKLLYDYADLPRLVRIQK